MKVRKGRYYGRNSKTDLKDELDSLKNKIENFSERYEQAKKRSDEAEKHSDQAERRTGLALKVCSIVVAALTAFIIGLSISNYVSLADFKKETKDRIDEWIGKSKRKPQLVLMAGKDKPLEGATIDEETIPTTEKGKISIKVHFHVLNKGDGLASPIFIKTYQNPPMNTGSNSFDEKEFKYEIGPVQRPYSLPPQSSTVAMIFMSFDSFKLPRQELPMLVKVYYGDQGEQLVKAKFFINILK